MNYAEKHGQTIDDTLYARVEAAKATRKPHVLVSFAMLGCADLVLPRNGKVVSLGWSGLSVETVETLHVGQYVAFDADAAKPHESLASVPFGPVVLIPVSAVELIDGDVW